MTDFSTVLQAFKNSLCREVDLGGLYARNAIAYKWKAPWRALLLREAVAWRLQDLLEQSLTLSRTGHLLGARILLRSAFETLAMLIYLNRSMRSVVAGNLDFHNFSDKTAKLLLGSRDKTTKTESINILTILAGANARYPGLSDWYAALSESAHPNFEGMLVAYSSADKKNHITTFRNRWADLHGNRHESALDACFEVFLHEYDNESSSALEELEAWIELNDSNLEATKPR
ncbi:hypothetical protein [Chitinimonas taiwanensis]|uniref:hypothetical protein n=1 Tax=Chitinimonas taiwanensis TaxID=240412 RepID=UPI0035AE971E